MKYSQFLLQSSLANAPAMLPKSQKVKAGTRKMKSFLLSKMKSSKESEDTQVHETWGDASMSSEGTGRAGG